MNPIEKQILRNQRLIMMKLNLEDEGDFADTELLLNPNKNKEDSSSCNIPYMDVPEEKQK